MRPCRQQEPHSEHPKGAVVKSLLNNRFSINLVPRRCRVKLLDAYRSGAAVLPLGNDQLHHPRADAGLRPALRVLTVARVAYRCEPHGQRQCAHCPTKKFRR